MKSVSKERMRSSSTFFVSKVWAESVMVKLMAFSCERRRATLFLAQSDGGVMDGVHINKYSHKVTYRRCL